MIVSIHQPNYLPWLGFFDKIKQSDTFVIFDNVQFPRGKNHFGHRNLVKTNVKSKWLTIPLVGKSEMKNFNEIEINYNGWNEEHLRLLKVFYSKTPYFDEYYSDLERILLTPYANLHELNTKLILHFLNILEIKTTILLCSKVCSDNITGGDRVMQLLKTLKATKYISGTGSGSMRYINEQEFRDNNIELIWQHYKHPTYRQMFKPFLPYMSIIDLIFNEGPKSKDII